MSSSRSSHFTSVSRVVSVLLNTPLVERRVESDHEDVHEAKDTVAIAMRDLSPVVSIDSFSELVSGITCILGSKCLTGMLAITKELSVSLGSESYDAEPPKFTNLRMVRFIVSCFRLGLTETSDYSLHSLYYTHDTT